MATAERAPELGAAWLAAEAGDHAAFHPKSSKAKSTVWRPRLTEQRNPRSENLEKMSAQELVEVFVEEEKLVQDALRNATADLVGAIQIVTESLRNGGRLFYVGAGSSGRIGVLMQAKSRPHLARRLNLVQGMIAGGVTALSRSVEGAEDDEGAGALAMDERRVKGRDVVIGITASGRTPFVLGALRRAKSLGAKTILLSCNPDRSHRPVAGPTDGPQGRSYSDLDLVIMLAVGPEILTGSTRLKAGTATKVALNIISTGAMVALGKVRGNLMIDLHATSAKLRDRAVRVVAELGMRPPLGAHNNSKRAAGICARRWRNCRIAFPISATEVARAKLGILTERNNHMLWTIFVILLVLWLLGLVSSTRLAG